MAKAVNGVLKAVGFIIAQICCSAGLYLCSLVVSCSAAGIAIATFQATKGFFPCIVLWKWLLAGSVPLWIVFEIQVNVRVWKIFHSRK